MSKSVLEVVGTTGQTLLHDVNTAHWADRAAHEGAGELVSLRHEQKSAQGLVEPVGIEPTTSSLQS